MKSILCILWPVVFLSFELGMIADTPQFTSNFCILPSSRSPAPSVYITIIAFVIVAVGFPVLPKSHQLGGPFHVISACICAPYLFPCIVITTSHLHLHQSTAYTLFFPFHLRHPLFPPGFSQCLLVSILFSPPVSHVFLYCHYRCRSIWSANLKNLVCNHIHCHPIHV